MCRTRRLKYNTVYLGAANTTADLNGILIAQNSTETLRDASLVVPLSSSLAVVVNSPSADSTQTGTEKILNV
jgi:hypothetical protein